MFMLTTGFYWSKFIDDAHELNWLICTEADYESFAQVLMEVLP